MRGFFSNLLFLALFLFANPNRVRGTTLSGETITMKLSSSDATPFINRRKLVATGTNILSVNCSTGTLVTFNLVDPTPYIGIFADIYPTVFDSSVVAQISSDYNDAMNNNGNLIPLHQDLDNAFKQLQSPSSSNYCRVVLTITAIKVAAPSGSGAGEYSFGMTSNTLYGNVIPGVYKYLQENYIPSVAPSPSPTESPTAKLTASPTAKLTASPTASADTPFTLILNPATLISLLTLIVSSIIMIIAIYLTVSYCKHLEKQNEQSAGGIGNRNVSLKIATGI
jgi:hypothetical protein